MSEQTLNTLQEIKHNFRLRSSNSDNINGIMNDIDDVYVWINKGQQNVTIASLDHEEANETEKVAELDANYRELIDLENKIKIQQKTMAEIKKRINQGEKIKDLMIPYENIKQQFQDQLMSEDTKYFANEKYVNFRQTIWNINHPDELMPKLLEDEDDDIVIGSTKISLKCPLTTTWFENPMTSTVCKHTFSQAAIFNLLRQSGGNIPCPVAGCNKRVTQQVLVADELMVDRVTRSRVREEKNASATQYFDVE